jgi:hypothetical protein
MEAECHQNIEELHLFIEAWLIGSVEKSKQKFQYFDDALDENFVIIHPNGKLQTKPEITHDFWHAYGSQPEHFAIEIRNITVRSASENFCVMTYEEWQTSTEQSARISSVVFRKSEDNNKIYWFHLHETWYPSK